MSRRTVLSSVALSVALLGCGSRSAPFLPDPPAETVNPAETCNGLDDDRNGRVDDPYRNDAGSYVHPEHCGACNTACTLDPGRDVARTCQTSDGGAPRCVSDSCQPGFAPTRDGRCAPLGERFCLSCASDEDCGTLRDARCVRIAGESRCSVGCGNGCPDGAVCDPALRVCTPSSGSCSCEAGDMFTAACSPQDAGASVDGGVCVGQATCQNGFYSACSVSGELCDEQDNDCDGDTDEDFKDELGAYSRSLLNCGRCGNACEASPVPGFAIACGGDPFAPACVLACPDAVNGIQVGDRLDANRAFDDACECVVSALDDRPGPRGQSDAQLDVDCDGADGRITTSFYVAVDGDDAGPGSPTRPLATISAALQRAQASRGTATPRLRVFVAGGTYTEALALADGVSIYGGYRRDFRALDPAAYPTEVRAPSSPRVAFGAAVRARDVGSTSTEVAWITFYGGDAIARGEPSVAGVFIGTSAQLTLREVVFWSGSAGEGTSGDDGAAGESEAAPAQGGDVPRIALEDTSHTCVAGAQNTVRGGEGGRARCGAANGGAGGSAACPLSAGAQQGDGEAGASSTGAPAAGGRGGDEATGPIFNGPACARNVCCGLADFSVASNYTGPQSGQNGAAGANGGAGAGCARSPGTFTSELTFTPTGGNPGSAGAPGGGGGGGGAGGGARMAWVDSDLTCQLPDGLGGGGGGGGAGGCGGAGGRPGTSAAPSVGLLLLGSALPQLTGVTFRSSAGGRGGAGGAGGDGASGGQGGAGGALALPERTTPPLAGASPGARGGSGGSGGSGGAGGGGCGGASVGVWLAGGGDAARVRAGNVFQLGSGGPGGEGGRGAVVGGNGTAGEVRDVYTQ